MHRRVVVVTPAEDLVHGAFGQSCDSGRCSSLQSQVTTQADLMLRWNSSVRILPFVLAFVFGIGGVVAARPAEDRELIPDATVPIPRLEFDSSGALVIRSSAWSS